MPGRIPFFDMLLSGVCHQLPDRCFTYQGQPLPLCARCMGTYLGALIALLVLWGTREGRSSRLPGRGIGVVLVALVGLWGLDGVNSMVELFTGRGVLYPPNNALRLATGLGLGTVIGIVLYPIYHLAMWRRHAPQRVLHRPSRVCVPICANCTALIVILSWRSAPFWLWNWAAGLTVLAVLSVVNGTLLVLALRRESQGRNVRDLAPYLALGCAAGIVEAGGLGLLRRLVVGI